MIIRRSRTGFIFIPVGAIVLLTLFLVHSCESDQTVTGDFRDPAVLARALTAAVEQNGDGSVISTSCAQTIFPDYVCSVAFYNGTVATYQIQVATDGSWWHST